jgi:His/Glu/Gln/Arg/opine family amino acid ABC transporter permease subunit
VKTLAIVMNWSDVWHDRGQLLHGLWVAVRISAVALALSVTVGLLLALARMSHTPLRWLASSWINVFRGVPVIVSAVWVYFGIALSLNVNFTVFEAAVIALTLLYSSFIAEIFRAALEAIPRGQREAGLAVGMSRARVFVSVILPQATKIAIPNIGSMLIGMIKDTSVLFVIGITDLFADVQNLSGSTAQYFPFLTAAALLYVVVAFVVDFIFRTLEKTMETPPKGRLARLATRRRRRRIEAIGARLETARRVPSPTRRSKWSRR